MGWAVGFDPKWARDIGYGVPSVCDLPGCDKVIDRGLGYVCGGDVYGGDHGCGLFFCPEHLVYGGPYDENGDELPEAEHVGARCDRCRDGEPPHEPTADTAEWMQHKLTHESWRPWRDENPDTVDVLRAALAAAGGSAS